MSVAFAIQHAKLTRRVILSPAPCFFTLSHKLRDFRETLVSIKVFIFSAILNEKFSF